VGGADQGPLGAHVFDAAQQELSKAAGVLDLAEDGFDDLLAQAGIDCDLLLTPSSPLARRFSFLSQPETLPSTLH